MAVHFLLVFCSGFVFKPVHLAAQDPQAQLENRIEGWRPLLRRDAWQAAADSCAALLQALPPGVYPKARALAWSLRGSALRQGGRLEEALDAHQKALELRRRTLGPAHEETANSLQNIGNCLLDLGRHREAGRWLQQAQQVKEKRFGQDSPRLIPLYNSLGQYYQLESNYERSGFYLQQALRLAGAQYGQASPRLIPILYGLAGVLGEQQRPDSAAALLHRAWQIQLDSTGRLHSMSVTLLSALGKNATRQGRPESGAQYLRQALVIADSLPQLPHRLRGECWLHLGNALFDLGDFAAAEAALRKSLDGLLSLPADRANALNSLGLVLRYRDQGDEALPLLTEAVNLYLQSEPNPANRRAAAAALLNTGSCFSDRRDWPAAQYYFERAAAQLAALPAARAEYAAALDKIAGCLLESGDYSGAARALQQAEQQAPTGQTGVRFAIALRRGDVHFRRQQWPAALEHYRKALALLPAGAFPYERLQARVALARALRQIARVSGQTADWQATLSEAQEAIGLLQSLKGKLWTEAGVIELRQIFDTPYDLAVEACLALRRPKQAWTYAEAFKGSVLQKLDWQAQLWTAGAGLRAPAPAAPPDPSKVQVALAPGQSLLSYYWTDSAAYTFVISADTFWVKKLDLNPGALSAAAEQFTAFCARHPKSVPEQQREAVYAEMLRLGRELYRQLAAPLEGVLKPEVLISPDGILHALPFEALVVAEGKTGFRFERHTYWIQKHAIGYVQSAGAWLQLRERAAGHTPASLLAFAPDFNRNSRGLKPLLYNVQEINAVREVAGGLAREGAEATKQEFLRLGPGRGVLLLSTHGVMNERQPAASYVAFTEPGGNSPVEGILSVGEIYGLQLPAELIVLSACQTAAGIVYRGEGIQSIARAFQCAGAGSLLAARWNVDDERTPDLMRDLFERLWEGDNKTRALASARRRYLEDNKDAAAHPYFWAGFSVWGNERPLPAGFWRKGWWIWGLGIAALALVGYFYRRFRSGFQHEAHLTGLF